MVSRGGTISVLAHLVVVSLVVRAGGSVLAVIAHQAPVVVEEWPSAPVPVAREGTPILGPVSSPPVIVPSVPSVPVGPGVALVAMDPRIVIPVDRGGSVSTPDASGGPAGSTDPPVLLSAPTPQYPGTLQAAGLAGRVIVEFVVDTAGRVEAGTAEVMETTDPAFGRAALVAVAEERFRPGRRFGEPVRARVRQAVRFDVH